MIELFDAQRLLPRRDHSAVAAGLTLALAAGALSVYAAHLQRELQHAQARAKQLDARVRILPQRTPATAALVADLQRQVQAAEAELAAFGPGPGAESAGAAPPPSAWLERLAQLGSQEVSLVRIDIDAQGGTRIEGLATHAQAVSGFVQAFSAAAARHDAAAHGTAAPTPRAVELRQDKTQTAHLRFQLRASPNLGTAPAAAPTPPFDAESLAAAPKTGPAGPAGTAGTPATPMTVAAQAAGTTKGQP